MDSRRHRGWGVLATAVVRFRHVQRSTFLFHKDTGAWCSCRLGKAKGEGGARRPFLWLGDFDAPPDELRELPWLDALEARAGELSAGLSTIGAIAAASAADYVGFRFPDRDWRSARLADEARSIKE